MPRLSRKEKSSNNLQLAPKSTKWHYSSMNLHLILFSEIMEYETDCRRPIDDQFRRFSHPKEGEHILGPFQIGVNSNIRYL